MVYKDLFLYLNDCHMQIPYNITKYHLVLYGIILCSIVLFGINNNLVWYNIISLCAILHFLVLYSVVWYYSVVILYKNEL